MSRTIWQSNCRNLLRFALPDDKRHFFTDAINQAKMRNLSAGEDTCRLTCALRKGTSKK